MDTNNNQGGEIDMKAAAKAFSQLGASKGGKARAEKLTAEERSEIAKKASLARWQSNIKRAEHEGELRIGDAVIACAVLEGGIRLISQRSMSTALGRHVTGSGTSKTKSSASSESGVAKLPGFLSAKNLNEFIDKDLAASLMSPIEYIPKHGGRTAYGFKAELFPKICDVWLRARDRGDVLLESQKQTAEKAYILMRGFAHVGIIALVDEATGYQDIRDRKALQEILDKYLRKEFSAWAKVFPDEFYRQIFRLRNWQWKGMKVNRPQVVAHYTKDLIYARLAPGILKELEERNPKQVNGRRKGNHTQLFTEDIGHPALANHLHAVIVTMRHCDTWEELMQRIDRSLPKRGDTLQLELFKDEDFH